MSRWQYLLKRILLAVPVVLFGVTITFLIVRLGPIDPAAAILGPTSTSGAEAERIREQLGLNDPLWEQYLQYIWNLVTLNMPNSWVISPGTPSFDLILIYLPRTMWLGFWSVLIALFVGIPLGFYAGLNPNTSGDYVASFSGIVWRAMPNFWLAVILVSILAQSQDLLGFEWATFLVETNIVTPPSLDFLKQPLTLLTSPGESWPELLAATKQIAPAALVLGSSSMGNEMRIGRTAVLETINSNYVETARAKGLPERTIVWKHVFRNALIPLIPIITSEAFILISGSVLVELVFAINGMGYLFYQASLQGDLPLVGALMYITIVLLVSVNILQDILYTVVDPRVGIDQN
ncbi:peptide/nickel transport system permease protein [Halogranum gelatinilyticum]|uniref:Peptide/nickel transport system permease protein n=1 Tax=Halogranum gelatinilyticum TaxID=660521 RepID=A0A1G9P034_9EURY|nr:ABC transporter permease [Halogranum gelatinilyticum]SDL92196.1 peptide/nickel transport system permease protein [Halogranum gelatinilyticum]